MFAAKLVDLPTITEAHKSFDRKNIYKTADICQMLQVTVPIENEDEVLIANEPVGQQTPHGITPPLYNVRKRRFRKRVSNKVIETVEAKVDELFRLDEEAEESQYELLNPSALNQPAVAVSTSSVLGAISSEPGTPFDMLGSVVEDDGHHEDEEGSSDDNDALGLELERALGQEESDDGGAADSAGGHAGTKEEDDDDEDEDDDDDDEEDGGDMDENEMEAMHHNKMVKSEIMDLEQTIAQKQREADATVNQIMRSRLLDVVSKLKQELELKKKQLGAVEGETSTHRPGSDLSSNPLGDDADNEDASDIDDDDDDIEGLF
jgi:transcription initiation factor TFIID subunit 7